MFIGTMKPTVADSQQENVMEDPTMSANTQPSEGAAAKKVVGTVAHATLESAPEVPGRRPWFKYRDLGVAAASCGLMRAQIMSTSDGRSEPTGWHHHVCEGQLVYVIKGWVDLSFEDGTSIRLKAGETLYIPGGLRHAETATSKELEIFEVSVPGEIGTVPCDPPSDG